MNPKCSEASSAKSQCGWVRGLRQVVLAATTELLQRHGTMFRMRIGLIFVDLRFRVIVAFRTRVLRLVLK